MGSVIYLFIHGQKTIIMFKKRTYKTLNGKIQLSAALDEIFRNSYRTCKNNITN